MTEPSDVTLVRDAIHNPDDPRHFMRVVPARERHVAEASGHRIAASDRAVVVKEVGRDIYDPVVYFPRDDVDMAALTRIERTTHCPLKGDTEYFDVVVGDERLGAAAWSYVVMRLGDELRNLIAFDRSQVRVVPET